MVELADVRQLIVIEHSQLAMFSRRLFISIGPASGTAGQGITEDLADHQRDVLDLLPSR
jgi:hypothetical protein